MRIETRDEVIPAQESQPSHRMDHRLIRRALLAIVLAGCLFAALRWALNVTNANERQLSNNLTNLKDGFQTQTSTAAPVTRPLDSQGKPKDARSNTGPILEPVDTR
jgi:hypothetical protein